MTGLLGLVYVFVVLPISILYRLRSEHTMPLGADRGMDTYWVESGSAAGWPGVSSSDEMIVTLRGSVIGGYLSSVRAARGRRRFVPALLAVLLSPLRWLKTPESSKIDPDIYAMH